MAAARRLAAPPDSTDADASAGTVANHIASHVIVADHAGLTVSGLQAGARAAVFASGGPERPCVITPGDRASVLAAMDVAYNAPIVHGVGQDAHRRPYTTPKALGWYASHKAGPEDEHRVLAAIRAMDAEVLALAQQNGGAMSPRELVAAHVQSAPGYIPTLHDSADKVHPAVHRAVLAAAAVDAKAWNTVGCVVGGEGWLCSHSRCGARALWPLT